MNAADCTEAEIDYFMGVEALASLYMEDDDSSDSSD